MNDPLNTQINFNISNSFVCTPKYAMPFSLEGANFAKAQEVIQEEGYFTIINLLFLFLFILILNFIVFFCFFNSKRHFLLLSQHFFLKFSSYEKINNFCFSAFKI